LRIAKKRIVIDFCPFFRHVISSLVPLLLLLLIDLPRVRELCDLITR
jgi:hypothetical protein